MFIREAVLLLLAVSFLGFAEEVEKSCAAGDTACKAGTEADEAGLLQAGVLSSKSIQQHSYNNSQTSCPVGAHVTCPYSNGNARCAGDQCCPKVYQSGYKTFTCPSASKDNVGCEMGKIESCTAPAPTPSPTSQPTFCTRNAIPGPSCVYQGGVCAGLGSSTSKCCTGLDCVYNSGGLSTCEYTSNIPGPKCLEVGQQCSGGDLGSATLACCEGTYCPGGPPAPAPTPPPPPTPAPAKHCQFPANYMGPRCVPENTICAGGLLGSSTQTCCEGTTCMQGPPLLGAPYGSTPPSTCMKNPFPGPACAPEGTTCAGGDLGSETFKCCTGMQCM